MSHVSLIVYPVGKNALFFLGFSGFQCMVLALRGQRLLCWPLPPGEVIVCAMPGPQLMSREAGLLGNKWLVIEKALFSLEFSFIYSFLTSQLSDVFKI